AGEAAVVAAPVVALSQGVIKAMLMTKLKTVAVAAVTGCAVLVTAAAGWRAEAGSPQDRPAEKATGAPKAAPRAQKSDGARIAEVERERGRLLKVVADLKDRVDALEKDRDREKQRAAQAEYARRVALAQDEWRGGRARAEEPRAAEPEARR